MKEETYLKIEKFVGTFWKIVIGAILGLFAFCTCALGLFMFSVFVFGFFGSVIASHVVATTVSIIVILAFLIVGVLTIIVFVRRSKNHNRQIF